MTAWYLENAFRDRDAFLQFEKNLLPWRTVPSNAGIRQSWKEIVDDDDADDDFLPSPFMLADITSEQSWNIQDLVDMAGKSASLNLGSEDSGFALVSLTKHRQCAPPNFSFIEPSTNIALDPCRHLLRQRPGSVRSIRHPI
jgi:hypothetical protein